MISYIQSNGINLTFRPSNREPVTALKDFSIELAQGEFVSIVGPSGCGKSTFLNILLGLIKPDGGEMKQIAELIQVGTVVPHVDSVFPLEKIADAHRRVETGHVRGKVVIKVAD